MRRPIIAANWKMNHGPRDTGEFLDTFLAKLDHATDYCDVIIAPPFVSLPMASEKLSSKSVSLAAQNISEHNFGAYTGEVSGVMLKELYVQHVIVGHSERRQIFQESDECINAKILKMREMNLRPIFCVGETLEERENGKLEETLRNQVQRGLANLTEKDILETIIAYEPVWAIGTGLTATPEQAQEAHKYVRSLIAEGFSSELSERVRIQYGGSVKPNNIAELLSQPDIDGALVGGASLDAISFLEIIQASKTTEN